MRSLLALAMTAPLIVAASTPASAQTATPPPPAAPAAYPQTRTVAQVDDYFGTKVADPYRWLEDDNAADTKAWVEAQNAVTFDYLGKISGRAAIRSRLTTLWNYERYGLPRKRGEHYVITRNDGLQNQAVYYRTRSLDAPPEVLLDPNTLSADGTIAVGGTTFSDDGRYMAYSLSESGSDWIRWKVREIATGKDLADEVRWSKFSSAAWLHDGSGFFYSRYDAPKAGEALTGVNKNQKVYFHKLGTPQDADVLTYARPDQPDWGLGADVTDDGKFLLIYQSEGTDPKNRIFVKDLTRPDSKVEPFLNDFDAMYNVVGNDGGDLLRAHQPGRAAQAPGRDHARPALVVGMEDADCRRSEAGRAGRRDDVGQPVRGHLADRRAEQAARVRTRWRHETRGQAADDRRGELHRPAGAGARASTRSRRSPTRPPSSGSTSPSGRSTTFKQPKVAFDPAQYETAQVFYTSKDGTRVPMFITHKKGLAKNGTNPTYLYGYGGFNISLTPSFSPANLAWLEMGGVYAVANLRGGGEYGKAWHDAGRLKNKQNVFDDFIAAAE